MPDDPLDQKQSDATSAAAASSSSAANESEREASSTSAPAAEPAPSSGAANLMSDEVQRLLRQFNAKPEGESEDARIIRQGRALHDLEKLGVVNMVRNTDDKVQEAKRALAAQQQAPPRARQPDDCAHCGKPNAKQRCSRCKGADRFCDKDCFRKGWRAHKTHCGGD